MTDERLKELQAIVGESEGEIQTMIHNYLESMDYIVIRHNSGHAKNNVKLSPKHTPDLQVIMFDAKSLWIEVKRPGEDLSQGQADMKANLERRGQVVMVARSVEDVREYLKI